MKKLNIYFVLIALITIGFCSCNKSIEAYVDSPQVYFFERATDLNKTRITNKSYSFLLVPPAIVKDTVKIKVKTMGFPKDYDRVVRGKIIQEGSTAIEGSNFDFINGIVKAGQVEGFLYVLVYRTADIKTKTVQLNLSIAETADFKPGVIEDNFFTVLWSDNLVKPGNWDGGLGLVNFFGAYSTAKYRFIIDILGVTDFVLQASARVPLAPGEYSFAMMTDLKNRMKEALVIYNNTHTTPLTDENGLLVSFPN
ncbi:DUF4843 domain-containing protein [Pedobacter sp. MC2016-14]|uniref:DUF4843 domain-containing protein n=1 Tax=Pedobacter sp. MC2016-14 TaxID=2897327 RepID=UPI001E2A41E2|nr:DUF4843 domain-containing protein [Pedobacter sp. MC2016-14]MCD0490396.1 DUF4843 domain-containing protein [Pedobacter sp. MC2016-14]